VRVAVLALRPLLRRARLGGEPGGAPLTRPLYVLAPPRRRRRRRAPALVFFAFALGLAVLIAFELLVRALT
jgi:hypothetical protein